MSNSAAELILVIDLGSSSVRASAYRTDGERLDGATGSRTVQQDADGTFDPELLTRLTESAVDDCLASLRGWQREFRLIGVAWTSFAMSLLGVDRNRRPVTPVYSYADSRSGPYADALRQELEAEGTLADTCTRTGTPIHTAYAPPQLLRLAAEEPDLFAQVACWQTIASHLLGRWQGLARAPISSSEVGWMGLLDRGAHSWDEALVERIGIDRAQLPPLNDYTKYSVGLVEPWASRWSELAQTPFFLAVGDGAGANLGSGCADSRRIALTIGTTGAMRVVIPAGEAGSTAATAQSQAPEVPDGLWSYPIDSSRWLVGGSLTDGGSLYSWLHEMLAVEDANELLAEAALMEPDEHGLTILPFLRSERAPGWATNATLTISGMTPATTPVHIQRAALEAVAFRFRLILDRLRPHLAPGSEVVASGGALHENPLWRQILADVLQKPVGLVNVDEATSRGAAILALQALGRPLPPAPPTLHSAAPNREAGPQYERALARQEALYRQVIGSAQAGGD